ncbi:unnamed protein product [Arctia plantaginis]|uniref:Uncharacterized protein n=1 Tax=Arctia plantaginis TaxID=874455 RepID=A0A8S1BN95_ARCPL|nr:unnamed protein product [Arctia plantaginis]
MEIRDAKNKVIRIKKMDIAAFVDSCRICMLRNSNMSGIFETESEHIIQEILFCTGITLKKEDGFPTKICTQCLKNLTVAYKFKTSCILADKTFRKLVIDTDIKAEVPEITDEEFDVHMEYEDEFEEKVKEEVDWEPVLTHNVRRKERLKKKEAAQSVLEKQPPKRVGRPKSATAAPRPLKKYKFKKLHCEPCNIKFTNKQQCDDHKKALHKDSNHWVCEICGKMFVHRASHYTHVKSHLPPQFACDQCDYKTSHKHDLVKHIRIHTGIKMYQCEYCTASYYTSSNLTMHTRRNHMKQRPFECSICRRTFFDRTKLNRHIDTHNDIKRFECEVCHACFTRRCYWKKHLLRQHDIVTPPQRPGRQKTNAVVGEELMEKVNLVIRPRDTVGDCLGDKSNVIDEYVIERVD